MRTVIRVLITVLIVILLAGMTVMIYNYRQETQARSARIAELSAQAKAYEAELTQLKREQETQEMQIYTPEGPGAAVVAFRVGGEETFAQAQAFGREYGFRPALLINTADEDLDYIIETVTDSGLEVILYSQGFSKNEAGRIRELHERLEEAGCENTDSYLLRASDDTEENRAALSRAGISTLFLYGDSLMSVIAEDGTAELNYSYINKSSYNPANRLADLNGSEQALLFAIDMKETTVTDRQMDEIVGLISEESDSGHIMIGTVENAVRTVRERMERENANLEAFETEQEERTARIAELEETIRDIYSHWDD